MQDPYCYPDSRVLKNKLNIHDFDELSLEERKLVKYRSRELFEEPIQGRFDFEHLKAILRYLFQDIFDWAGEVRTVDIAKGNLFCRCFVIEAEAKRIFGELKQEKYLRGLMIGDLSERLAYYLSEINALHPFREGNGRSQREFVRQLALLNGYFLSFVRIKEASFRLDYEPMQKLILNHLRAI